MVRRWALPLAAALSLLLAATPATAMAATTAMAAGTSHYQERGTGMDAGWTNLTWDEEGNIPAGDYFETYVSAASYVAKGDGSWTDQYVCIDHYTFSVDAEGNWIDGDYLSACGTADTLMVNGRLAGGQVTASFEAQDCTAWDENTGECTEWTDLGTLAVDLTLSGIGRIEQYHSTNSGGTAGLYQYTSHGTGSDRMADVVGSVTLDGASLTDGATMSYGWLFQSRSGYVDVWHL